MPPEEIYINRYTRSDKKAYGSNIADQRFINLFACDLIRIISNKRSR